MNNRIGRFVETVAFDETVRAFVPQPLPPNPPIAFTERLVALQSAADLAVGRLDGVAMLLPDKTLFLYMYVRKEAVLSSQIEGTQSTLDDLLRFESAAMSGQPIDDITEVSNYVDAMMFGLDKLKDTTSQGLPLCLRLIREVHARLLKKGRGQSKDPGQFRRTQNWIGGSRPGNALYVPPPVSELDECLANLEKYIQDDNTRTPALIRAGLLHVQFESIHPFLDGNGRVGRLLIALFLVERGVLREPLLYLSLYLKAHREKYYELLQAVRTQGDWESWLEFFLIGVAETADKAHQSALQIVSLFQRDQEKIRSFAGQSQSMLKIHAILQRKPFVNAAQLQELADLSAPTVNVGLAGLESLGIVREVTGKQRRRVYAYAEFLRILDEGTGV